MPRPKRTTRGVVLLDVLVALALLGLTGTALLAMVAQSQWAVEHAQGTEREQAMADALLTRIAQLPDSALLQLAGRRRVDRLELRVSLVTAELIRIEVAEPAANAMLETITYRPGLRHAP